MQKRYTYHEFSSLGATDDISSDMHNRSIDEFLAEVTREDQRGWQVFDPNDSVGSLNWFLTQERA